LASCDVEDWTHQQDFLICAWLRSEVIVVQVSRWILRKVAVVREKKKKRERERQGAWQLA